MSQPIPISTAEKLFLLRRAGGEGAAALLGQLPRTPMELVALAQQLNVDRQRRTDLLDVLVPRWQESDLPAASRASVDMLLEGAHIIVTGQQPALAGGPLMLLTKALSAVRLAAILRENGTPAVPVFWIADEDHDVSELYSGVVPRPDDEPWSLDIPFADKRRPLRDLVLDDEEGASIVEQFRENLAGLPASAEVLRALEETVDHSPACWFRRLLLSLTKECGILPLHPSWLDQLSGPLIAAEVEQAGRLATECAPTMSRMKELGITVPIEQPEQLPLFWIGEDGGRHRLAVTEDGVVTRSAAANLRAVEVWAEDARQHADRYSADALLRPLIQDQLLQPFATIVGPTELAYQAQLALAYSARGIERPVLIPRLRIHLLEQGLAADLEAVDIDPAELLAAESVEDLVASPLANRLLGQLEEHQGNLTRWLETLSESAPHSTSMRKRADRLTRRFAGDFEKLARIIRREVDEGVEKPRRIAHEAAAAMIIDSTPAERRLSVLYALSRYGIALIERIRDAFDPCDERARIIVSTIVRKSES